MMYYLPLTSFFYFDLLKTLEFYSGFIIVSLVLYKNLFYFNLIINLMLNRLVLKEKIFWIHLQIIPAHLTCYIYYTEIIIK